MAHVDIAPTIMDAAGLPVPTTMDGDSLLVQSSRTDMLTEAWGDDFAPWWASLRTADYQYIEWYASDGQTVASRAFYDLDSDPWQMANLLGDATIRGDPDVNALHDRLVAARACAGMIGSTSCESALSSTSVVGTDVQVPEGADQAVFEVKLSRASDVDVEIQYATSDGTASSPADYGEAIGTLIVPAGEASGLIPVSVFDDSLDEPDETFFLELSSAVGATITDSAATATITSDDVVSLSIADASASEDEQSLSFTVSLSTASSEPVSVSFATANGSATAGEDYQALQGTLSIPPGQSSAALEVPLVDDAIVEAPETLTVTLLSPSRGTLADGEATGVIVDNEPPPGATPELSISDASALEGQGSMVFAVTLSEASTERVTVSYSAPSGTARAGKDYKRTSRKVQFSPGQTSADLTVTLLPDSIDEPDETFLVILSSPSGATIADGEAIGTIIDDDPSP